MRNIYITFSDGSSREVYGELDILENGDYRISVPNAGSIDIKKEYIKALACDAEVMF